MRSTSKVLVLWMVMCSAAVLTAQTSGALLYATGNVTVNGVAVVDASSIFTGDRLVTADSSIGSVNRNGSSVVVSPNSTIQYGKSGVEVIAGAAHVSTVNGMSAEVSNVKIAPTSQVAKFDVVLANNQLVVTSREGSVTIDDGGHTAILKAGDHTTLALGPTTNQSLLQAQDGPIIGKTEPAAKVVANGPFYTLVETDTTIYPCSVLQCQQVQSVVHPCKCPPPH